MSFFANQINRLKQKIIQDIEAIQADLDLKEEFKRAKFIKDARRRNELRIELECELKKLKNEVIFLED